MRMAERVPTHMRHFQTVAGQMNFPLQNIVWPKRGACSRNEDQVIVRLVSLPEPSDFEAMPLLVNSEGCDARCCASWAC